jgi:hypothetical protein
MQCVVFVGRGYAPLQKRVILAILSSTELSLRHLGFWKRRVERGGGKDTNMRFLRVGLAYVCVDVRTLTLEPCELELFVSSFNRYLRFVY